MGTDAQSPEDTGVIIRGSGSRRIRVPRVFKDIVNFRAGRASYDTIKRRIISSSKIDGIHLAQLMAAMIIASVGLNVDSTEAIIGSMLICPLMGSVIAISYSIATVDLKMFRRSAMELGVQFVVCLITSTVYFALSPLSNTTSSLLTNSSPTIWDVLIALVGGFAGAFGISRQQEPGTLLSGVAVATALMPPLCATGYGLAGGHMALAASALYEFLVNVVFIAFGSELALIVLHVPLRQDMDGDGVVSAEDARETKAVSQRIRRRLVLGSLIFALPCIVFSVQMVNTAMQQNGTVFEVTDRYDAQLTSEELHILLPGLVEYRIGAEDSLDTRTGELEQRVVATVVTDSALSAEERNMAEELIRLHVEQLDSVQFEVRPRVRLGNGIPADTE